MVVADKVTVGVVLVVGGFDVAPFVGRFDVNVGMVEPMVLE
jgi:hypothetical protein